MGAMGQRLAKKLLIVGWDAADWKLIDPLLAQGRLPNVKRLIDSGVRGQLRTLEPRLSPLLWNSIATGKRADKHGILNFVEPESTGGGIRPSTSTSRKTKALWNILSQSGLRTNVVSWYASHPAEPIRGVCVSNMLCEGVPKKAGESWALASQSVHPAGLAEGIALARVHPLRVDAKELRGLVPDLAKMATGDVRFGLLQRLTAQAHSVQNAAAWLMEKGPAWDCMLVFNEAIDVFGHHFMAYHPPKMASVNEKDFARFRGVMDAVYEMQDRMLGRLLQLADAETTVILVSDHGFHSDHLRPAVAPAADDKHAAMDATWHREHGVIILSGPGIARGTGEAPKEVLGATLLDVAPTALALLGLAVGGDMDGRVLVEALAQPVEIERVESWDAVEGDSGMHPADMRVDTIESAQAVKQLIELGYLADMSGDEQKMLDTVDRETRFNLAVVKLSRGEFVAAAEVLQALVDAVPTEPRYSVTLAQCLYQAGEFARARGVIEGFMKHSPGHPEAGLVLAGALIAEGKAAEAAAMLEKDRAGGGGAPSPHWDCQLGSAYIELREAGKAEEAFGRAAAADPHNAQARLGLAQADLLRDRNETAAEHAFEAVQLQHFLPEGHYLLGVALARHGAAAKGSAAESEELRHAVQFLGIAVSMQPGYLDAHRYLASIHALRGEAELAAKHRGIAEGLMGRVGKGGGFVDPLGEPALGVGRVRG